MENVQARENGSILLETSIVLPIFILVIVFVYGIFIIVDAQNVVTHSLIQSTDSLAMDAYLTENVESYDPSDATTFWGGLTDLVLDIARSGNSEYFSAKQEANSSIAKKRFIAYLTGGDEEAAVAKLNALHIADGLEGMTFHVESDDKDITVTISYAIQFPFDFLGFGKIQMNQSFTARLWA